MLAMVTDIVIRDRLLTIAAVSASGLSILGLGGEIENKNGLIDLDSLGTSLLELGEELLVDRQKALEEVDGVNRLTSVSLTEVKETDGANKDGAGGDTSLLSLLELSNSLGALSELERLVVLESGLDVVVVGVKPLNHLETGDIDTLLLVATAHGEVLINGIKTILGVTVGDSLR